MGRGFLVIAGGILWLRNKSDDDGEDGKHVEINWLLETCLELAVVLPVDESGSFHDGEVGCSTGHDVIDRSVLDPRQDARTNILTNRPLNFRGNTNKQTAQEKEAYCGSR